MRSDTRTRTIVLSSFSVTAHFESQRNFLEWTLRTLRLEVNAGSRILVAWDASKGGDKRTKWHHVPGIAQMVPQARTVTTGNPDSMESLSTLSRWRFILAGNLTVDTSGPDSGGGGGSGGNAGNGGRADRSRFCTGGNGGSAGSGGMGGAGGDSGDFQIRYVRAHSKDGRLLDQSEVAVAIVRTSLPPGLVA